jgi:hypothetical protein
VFSLTPTLTCLIINEVRLVSKLKKVNICTNLPIAVLASTTDAPKLLVSAVAG